MNNPKDRTIKIMETIRGVVLTEQRANHKEVTIRQGEREGFDLYVPTYMDFLLEEKIITKTLKDWGNSYWNLKEAALSFMGVAKNKLYQDFAGEDGCEDFSRLDEVERDALAVYIILTRKMPHNYRKALDAACNSTEGQTEGQKYEYIRAFGENTILQAFQFLQSAIPEANKEFEERVR